ncbi:hypothetical protein BL240_00460 [Pseudomonas putida]|uniref:Uncharacterized protein n=1 Tax=Pseudomonas putida TaxID=303 RepID=A0A1L5PIH8_PSEPU|nr:hypothetical protein BL240_00460 [Pseudomonas putida]
MRCRAAIGGTRKQEPVGFIRLREILPNGLLMKLVMVYVCELYTNQPLGRWLPRFLMMLLSRLISLLGKFYVCRSYY